MFDEITASNLVNIGLDGRAVEPSTERQFNDPGRPLDEGELSDPDAMQLAWAALLRLLERVAPGYRD